MGPCFISKIKNGYTSYKLNGSLTCYHIIQTFLSSLKLNSIIDIPCPNKHLVFVLKPPLKGIKLNTTFNFSRFDWKIKNCFFFVGKRHFISLFVYGINSLDIFGHLAGMDFKKFIALLNFLVYWLPLYSKKFVLENMNLLLWFLRDPCRTPNFLCSLGSICNEKVKWKSLSNAVTCQSSATSVTVITLI